MTKRIHSCKEMKKQLELDCDLHSDPFECADHLVLYNARFDEYGIIIHDAERALVGRQKLSFRKNKFDQ